MSRDGTSRTAISNTSSMRDIDSDNHSKASPSVFSRSSQRTFLKKKKKNYNNTKKSNDTSKQPFENEDGEVMEAPPRPYTGIYPGFNSSSTSHLPFTSPNKGHRSVAEAIEDPNSELNSFLDTDKQPLYSNKAFFYSLALDPLDVRNERIVAMSEAYAVFGALFLTGQQFVWEYATVNEFQSEYLERAFLFINSIGIITNVYMAMIAGFLWLLSILFSANHPSWVFGAKAILNYLHHLLVMIFVSTSLSLVIGVWNNSPHPESIAAMVVSLLVMVSGMYRIAFLIARQAPLEYHHFPLWFKYLILPFPLLRKKERASLKEGAKQRAEELKDRAAKEHTIEGNKTIVPELKLLLEDAAIKIGYNDLDVAPFLAKLIDDLYDTVDSMKKEDIDALSNYMPRRLARAVYEILEEQGYH